MKYYIVEQVNATGNGSSTTVALVTNPQFEGAGIRATKVGVIDCERSGFGFNEYIFKKIAPVEFLIIGNATCEECVNPFGE